MGRTFERWQSTFATQVGKVRDKEAGHPTLLYDSECDDETLQTWYMQGVTPSEAAKMFLAGEGRAS
jgi:hypothetical protein